MPLRTYTISPASGTRDSAVIFLHGLGTNGHDLLGLGEAWQYSLPNTLFIAPDAPEPFDMGPHDYQWFSLQDRDPASILNGVKRSAPALNGLIDETMQTYGLAANRIALVGFSQGAMMSLYVAPRRAQQMAGVISFSGALVGAETLAAEKQSTPPVLLVHGTNDDIVPFPAMAHAQANLVQNSITVETMARPELGHGIDDGALEAGELFLKKVLAAG